ncbi:MAG: hypothetical protein KDD36_03925 [Flavobacteriales bacterium]|nr:hypothetical protein [Flavobacteriales bacterium]
MIKICITVGLICIGFFHVEGQELRWVNSCKHADDAETKGVVMDHSGNIYSTGYFQDTLVVGPDTIVSHGNNDIFLFAHDSLGNELWHTTFGGKLNDQANAIAIDPAGNIWITGGVNDSIFVEDTLFTTGTTSQTLFFARYSKSGQYISMNLIPGAIYSQAQDIEIDSDFTAILTGQFYGTISKDNVTLSNPTGKTFYILKVDVTGTILWGRMCTGNANNGSDISIGPDAYYVTGSYNDGAQFGIQVLHAYGNNHNLFVAKYSKAGSLQWIQTQTGPAEVHGLKVSTNNNDRILVAGEFASKIDDLEYESKGSLDMVLLCYDPNGGLQWSKPIGGINADKTNGIATDGEDFYLTGMFSDSVLFSDTTIVAGGINATFIMKLDQFGNRHWFRQLAGTANNGAEIAQEDVYVWLVKAIDCYGEKWRRTGHVALIR